MSQTNYRSSRIHNNGLEQITNEKISRMWHQQNIIFLRGFFGVFKSTYKLMITCKISNINCLLSYIQYQHRLSQILCNIYITYLTQDATYIKPKSTKTKDSTQYRSITGLHSLYQSITGYTTNKIYNPLEQQKGSSRDYMR